MEVWASMLLFLWLIPLYAELLNAVDWYRRQAAKRRCGLITIEPFHTVSRFHYPLFYLWHNKAYEDEETCNCKC